MKILGIIPARGGSKGVPRKNVKLLSGKPLIAYTILSANESVFLTDVILSSEDAEIIDCAKAYHLDVPFIRPSNLATDEASSIAVVQHALAFMESQGKKYDAVCLLQVTCPFRAAGFIDRAIDKFINSKTDALVSVLEIPHEYNPHWAFSVTAEGNLQIATGETEIIKRRQDLPKSYHRDGSVYISSVESIKAGSFYGATLSFIESDPQFYVNIDTPSDWDKAERIALKELNNN